MWIILGSFPLGSAIFVLLPGTLALAFTIMLLDTAHVVSPMITAWAKPGLRAVIRREWVKHIALPIVVVGAFAFLPLPIAALIYWPWNSFHFGMQNFGVLAMRGWRRCGFVALCGTMLCMSIVPLFRPNPIMSAVLLGAFSVNHWITDITLSSRVVRWQWWFLTLVLAIGAGWFLLRQGPLSVRVLPQIVQIRYGIGIVHFIYSARIWKMSDPQVRATIGSFHTEPS
jgi:hypothetical protein